MVLSNWNIIDFLLIIISYLIGSIPFGYLLTKKSTGEDIRKFGSGNIGSTNVKRLAGKKIALYTQLLDMFKGLFPVLVILILQKTGICSFNKIFIYLIAGATIIGHNFSIFLKFKGGKGVNTSLGASVLLAPIPVFISVAVYYFVKWLTKYVSLGSIILGLSLAISSFLINGITAQFYYLLFCFIFILFRHIPNIKRLINGKEPKT